jgi:hypothetical protein
MAFTAAVETAGDCENGLPFVDDSFSTTNSHTTFPFPPNVHTPFITDRFYPSHNTTAESQPAAVIFSSRTSTADEERSILCVRVI